MTYLILGGGLQGRAAIYALRRLDPEATIIVGDLNTEPARAFVDRVGLPAPMFVQLDASDTDAVKKWVKQVGVVIDLLPITFTEKMAELAVDAGTHLVNTFYPGRTRDLHEKAVEKGGTILPEMGMDPGIVSVKVVGGKEGRHVAITDTLIDRRDLKTGLYAMNRMVGFSAAITARMIAYGVISSRGVLSPARDVPVNPFIEGLSQFGMEITRTIDYYS